MTKSKKLLSLFLAVLMAFSSLTVGLYAFAADEETETPPAELTAAEKVAKAIDDFYTCKYNTLMFSTKEEEAEKKAEALKAFDDIAASVKALSESEKMELDISHYVYILSLAADKVGRDNGLSGNAAKLYGTGEGFPTVVEKFGALPAEYQKGYEFCKEFYVKIDNTLFNSSFNFVQHPEGKDHYINMMAKFKTLTPEGIAFANFMYPATDSAYIYASTPTSTNNRIFLSVLPMIFNYHQDTETATGADPKAPSVSTFIDSKKVDGEYVRTWKDGQNALAYKAAYDAYFEQYLTDTLAPAKNAFAYATDLFSAIYGDDFKNAVQVTYEKGMQYYETGKITVDEINDVIAANDAVSDKYAVAALKELTSSTYLKVAAYTTCNIEYTADSTAEEVYSNQIKLQVKYVSKLLQDMKDVLVKLQVEEFEATVKAVDLDNLDADTIANVKALYVAIPSNFRSTVSIDTYAKLMQIVKPAADGYNFAEEVSNFKTIPVNRADIGGDIIWTEEGVQNSVDGTYALVKTVLGFLNLEINGNKVDLTNGLNDLLKDNVYQASVINAIYDLYASLSHNETETGVSLVPTIGAVVQMLFSKDVITDLLVQNDKKYAGAIEKIKAFANVTDEEKAEGINELDKIAAIEFTDADFGFKNGDKDGFIDAILAAIRPITYILSGDNGLLLFAGINIKMFDSVNSADGEYAESGIYAMLLPLLEQIGLTDLPTPVEYRTNYYTVRAAETNLGYDEVLRPIVNSLFTNVIQPVADSPFDGVIDILPRIAYVIYTNMVDDTVKAVINSTGNTLAGLVGGLDLSAKAINNMIAGVTIQIDDETSIQLKPINWHILSDCATVEAVPSHSNTNDYVMLRTGDVDSCFSTVYFYIYELLFANQNTYNAVKALLASAVDKTLLSIITSVTDNLAGAGRNQSFGQFLKLTGYEGETAIPRTKADAQKRFTDLAGAEYYDDYVAYTSVYNSFITGTNPPQRTLFSPNATITRAMFITILYRMDGEPYKNANPHDKTPFTDITDTSVYYYDAACWALDQGISNQTTFRAYDNVSRQETAAFLFRYAQINDLILNENYKSVDLSVFNDSETIRDWAQECMQWANYNGMITGTQQGNANPDGATLRIHATKILYGFGKTCDIGNFA